VDPDRDDVETAVGDALVDRRKVFLEPWALIAYGAALARDPQIRRWLPPARMPHHHLAGLRLSRPRLPEVRLTEPQAAALRLSDGRTPAVVVAARLAADPALGLAGGSDAEALLDRLVERELLTWDANLPLGPRTEAVLEERIAAIGPEEPRARAYDGLRRLRAARDAVAAAAGDPVALPSAIRALEAEFTRTTGEQARRKRGMAYAGRGVCYEDTNRDLRMTLGARLFDDLAPALDVVLRAARWLTGELAAAYEGELGRLHRALSARGGDVTLGDLWFPALRPFIGRGGGPFAVVMEEFAARWARLIAAGERSADGRQVRLTTERIARSAAEVFAAERPGWSAGRIHSPDLQICAASPQAVNEGRYHVVLAEMHAAVATMCGELFTWSHTDPDRIAELALADVGGKRVMPLYPPVWPRNAGRTIPFEHASGDRFVAFAATPGADPQRVTPVAGVPVRCVDGRLYAEVSGERWPLVEVFSAFLATFAADAFKVVPAAGHTPRITLDRLVLFRETWRTTAEGSGLTPVRPEAEEFLAARAWRRRLGLPELCFVALETETKPFFVDLSSPLGVSAFCAALRAACRTRRADVGLTVTEMLPTPDQAWVPGPGGEHYFGEIRLHVTDPAAPITQPVPLHHHDRRPPPPGTAPAETPIPPATARTGPA
jgi:hypothetical protein